jgi:Ankyrin repeats (many copies)
MPKNETVLDRVSGALHREDWSLIVKMARDPISSRLVTNARVGFGGGTALHMASYCHKLDVLMVLLDAGAVLTAKDKEGYTPLHIAALSGAHRVAELLLARGADVSAINAYGWTPLHAASVNGHREVAQLLITHGAMSTAAAKDGRTPAVIAAASGHMELAQSLRQAAAGAKVKARRRVLSDEDDEDDEDGEDDEDARSAAGKRRKVLGRDAAGDDDAGSDEEADSGDKRGAGCEEGLKFRAAGAAGGHRRPPPVCVQARNGSQPALPPPSRWARPTSCSPPARDFSARDPSPDAGCPSAHNSPVTIRTGNDGFGHVKRTCRCPHQNQRGSSPGLPVLPPPPPLSMRVMNGGGQMHNAVDVGKLSVDEVASLIVRYVCEGHDEETKRNFSARLRSGVSAYRLTGRTLLAHDPSPSDLARALLLEQSCVGHDLSASAVDRDVLFFSVMDFIRVARLRTSSSAAFLASPASTPNPGVPGPAAPAPAAATTAGAPAASENQAAP